ncbi:uncharacterized protein LOC129760811 [Uranotaenia lowii]|uniref:uncharacterized protein LOC129760811 n=1 Tax=Uranotaenia lowii TaxID=190385 RepID=UPI002478488C|nr:uncharacterized protein LOC129760811 [Uranotaenia lowii]
MSAGYNLEQLPSPLAAIGAKPAWDADSLSLYYCDILRANIIRYDYVENKTYTCSIDGVSPIAPIVLVQGKSDEFVLGSGNKLVLIKWDGRSEKGTLIKTVGDLGESEAHVRFNDGKVDSRGRLLIGSMRLDSLGDIFDQQEGKLYRFDGKVGGKFIEQKRNISVSNGLTWVEKTGKFYYIDSARLDVKEFDVSENGDLKNEVVLYDYDKDRKGKDHLGFILDGMTSDSDGKLYITTWGGSKIIIMNPTTKTVEQEIEMPAKFVTSVTFGGPQMDELFVTTAHVDTEPAPAGSLFKITGLGVKGPKINKMILVDMATGYSVEQLPSPLVPLGEGPVWDADSQSLYYCDIMGAAILRYDYAENKTYSATIDGVSPISPIILVQGKPDEFVLGAGNKLVLVRWDGRSEKGTLIKTVGDLGKSEAHVRFNDGKVDPQGRLMIGTMRLETLGDIFDQKEGKLYRFDGKVGGKFFEQKRNISVSNGLTWIEKTGKFYYQDSAALDVKEFDVAENGDLKNEVVLYNFDKDGKGKDHVGFVCDGMTSDVEGNLYIATWGGSKLLKMNPKTKIIEQEIAIPAKQVTSASFGGPNMDELFVTTAHTNTEPAPAGALFKVTGLGVKGSKMYKMVLQQ